jgi:hypothetical protein
LLLYLMMTLGPALMLLASFERVRGAFACLLATFGQVPFLYYVVHIYLIHVLAVATAFDMTGVLTSTPAIGLSLAGVYFVWLLVLVLLYPICRWFAGLKERGRGWWWSYLESPVRHWRRGPPSGRGRGEEEVCPARSARRFELGDAGAREDLRPSSGLW